MSESEAPERIDHGKRGAHILAMRLWELHYKNTSPNWSPLNDTAGIISQIDNMVSGICRERERLQAQVAELEKWDVLESKAYNELKAELQAVRAENEALKATNKKLNRRCQSAESGLLAKLKAAGPAGSFNRALANSAAILYAKMCEELRAENERLKKQYRHLYASAVDNDFDKLYHPEPDPHLLEEQG